MAEKTINYIKLPDGETYKIGGSGSGFNLFDTKVSDHILEGEEALGWALQGTYVTKTEYPDAYNKILNKYNDTNNTIEPLAKMYKTVGSPTYSAVTGNLTNITTTAYAYMDIAVPKNNTLSIETEFQLSSLGAYTVISHKNTSDFVATTADGYITFSVTMSDSSVVTATGTKVLSTGKKYKAIFERTETEFKLSVYNEGVLVDSISATVDSSLNIGTDSYTAYYIGVNKSVGVAFNGYINITKTEFYIGSSYYPCTINAYVNSNGMKIYDTYNKTYIDTIYTNTGIVEYYGIDFINERIFLPRNDKFIQLTSDTSKVNDCIEAGLPNITGATSYSGRHTSALANEGEGALRTSTLGSKIGAYTGTDAYNIKHTFDASLSNPIYGNSNTVQPPSSLKLLYYCVGNTKVESAVSNVTEITTSENDTLPLFHNFYSQEDMTTTGAYVNASLGSWLSGNVYTTAYNELVNKLGADNVKANTDTYTDYDFVLNQDDMTFRLPLLNGSEDLPDYSKGQTIDSGFVAPCNGRVILQNNALSSAQAYLYVNGVEVGFASGGTTIQDPHTLSTDVVKGDVVTFTNMSGNHRKFHKKVGNGNLYYKLSNTVTNLEILDVAKITADLNTCYKKNASDNSDLSGLAMPSNKYIDLTLNASGSSYTAPANGYFVLSKISNGTNQYITMGVGVLQITNYCPQSGRWFQMVTPPVQKGQSCYVAYDLGGTTNFFRFYYAEGEV